MKSKAKASICDQSDCICAFGIVGLFNICESPLVAFQSAFTFTSAPTAIPANLFFSVVV